MKKVLAVSAAVLISGCVSINTNKIQTDDGKVLGYLTTYEHTGDLGGWQNGAIVYSVDGKFVDHKTDRANGLLPEVLQAGAVVGSGYFVGRGLSRSGDSVNNSNTNANSSSSSSWANNHNSNFNVNTNKNLNRNTNNPPMNNMD